MRRVDFTLVQQTDGHPHYVHQSNDVKLEIYFGEPPLAPRGIYMLMRAGGSEEVFRFLIRRMDHFDAHELAAVADNFLLSIE
jgi:hypothetical protein